MTGAVVTGGVGSGDGAARPERPAYRAIVLAGGRGSRLGGVDKGALAVAGTALLDRVLAAAGGAEHIVVVGDCPVPEGVMHTREEPAYGGPAAAVVAGLQALRMPPASAGPTSSGASGAARATVARPRLVLVLACDLPCAAEGVELLLDAAAREHARADIDGWCLAEPDGRMQWLFGLYREAALKQAAHVLGNPTDRSMGRLVGRLTLRAVPAPAHVTADIDTPEDLARWTR